MMFDPNTMSYAGILFFHIFLRSRGNDSWRKYADMSRQEGVYASMGSRGLSSDDLQQVRIVLFSVEMK